MRFMRGVLTTVLVTLASCNAPESPPAPPPSPYGPEWTLPRLWIEEAQEPRALAQLREAVGTSPPGGDVVDWLEAESRTVPLHGLLDRDTFDALRDPRLISRIEIPDDWRERVPPSLAAAYDRTVGRTSDPRVRVVAQAAVLGQIQRNDRAAWELDWKGQPYGEGLEDADHRFEVAATTFDAAKLLYALETRVEAVDGERRIGIGDPIHGCATAIDDHLILTARRLVAPAEYDPQLAAAIASHQAGGLRIETSVTLASVSSREGGSFRWPASQDPTSRVRNLELLPDELRELGAGAREVALFRTRGIQLPCGSHLGNPGVSYLDSSVAIVLGAVPRASGLGRWRVIGELEASDRLRVSRKIESALGAPVITVNDDGGVLVGIVTGQSDGGLEFGRIPLGDSTAEPAVATGTRLRRGRVVDESGRPLNRLMIHVFSGDLAVPNFDAYMDTTSTDGFGVFELPEHDAPRSLVVTNVGGGGILWGRELGPPVVIAAGPGDIELVVPAHDSEPIRPTTWFALGKPILYQGAERPLSDLGRLVLRGAHWFEAVPGPPAQIDDLPTVDQGARLEVRAQPGPSGDIVLAATLRSGPVAVHRAVEHHYTVGISLLLALEADGEPIFARSDGPNGLSGGARNMLLLAPAGGSWSWSLRVQREKLEVLLPRPLPRRVAVTLAFCEFQPEPDFLPWLRANDREPFVDLGLVVRPPILVRSERVFIEHGPNGWRPAQ